MVVVLVGLDRYEARVYGQVNFELCDQREAGFAIDCTYSMNGDRERKWLTGLARGKHVTGPVSGLLPAGWPNELLSVCVSFIGPQHPIMQCKYRLGALPIVVALLQSGLKTITLIHLSSF